jgi:hypothetical protein
MCVSLISAKKPGRLRGLPWKRSGPGRCGGDDGLSDRDSACLTEMRGKRADGVRLVAIDGVAIGADDEVRPMRGACPHRQGGDQLYPTDGPANRADLAAAPEAVWGRVSKSETRTGPSHRPSRRLHPRSYRQTTCLPRKGPGAWRTAGFSDEPVTSPRSQNRQDRDDRGHAVGVTAAFVTERDASLRRRVIRATAARGTAQQGMYAG